MAPVSVSEWSDGSCVSPPSSPESTVLTGTQRTILEEIERSSTSAQRLVTRSRILLAYDRGLSKHQIAKTVKQDRKVVRKWCRRWDEASDLLRDTESHGISKTAYRAVIAEVLNDAFRAGAPVTFSAEELGKKGQYGILASMKAAKPSCLIRPPNSLRLYVQAHRLAESN